MSDHEKVLSELDMTEEEFDEYLKVMDEIDDTAFKTPERFYVLKERAEGREERISLKELKKQLPLDEIRSNQVGNLNPEAVFVEVEGSYYPDYLEEDGVYFVSERFLQYILMRINLEDTIYNRAGFVSEGRKRIEEYHLIVPVTLDCIIEGSKRYDKAGRLAYFEIDEEKTRDYSFFRIKGFPHIIVKEKLNRINFAGFECVLLNNFLDTEGVRDRLYQERLSGRRFEEMVGLYERNAEDIGNYGCIYGLKSVINQPKLQEEICQGLKAVFDSYNGGQVQTECLSERLIAMTWCWDSHRIELRENHRDFFQQTGFGLKRLPEIKAFITKLPEELQKYAKRLCIEMVIHLLAKESRSFDKYNKIHRNEKYKLYLAIDELNTTNIPMIYDYKSILQRELESKKEFKMMNFTSMDLREVDFSGKDLSGQKFVECNLRRAKFHDCSLNQVEFIGCNLEGAEFKKSILHEAVFRNNHMNWANFDYADLRGTVFTGSDLFHCSFVNSDLTEARITNKNFSKVFFYKAKLLRAIFEFETLFDSVFRLCDLRYSQFIGGIDQDSLIRFCDFSNANISEGYFHVNMIADTEFVRSNLIGVSFANCEVLTKSSFRWATCTGIDMSGLVVEENDFSHVNLSWLKIKRGIRFSGNNFTYANLSGYQFAPGDSLGSNKFRYTNLSGCNLANVDLRTDIILFPNLREAIMNGAVLTEEQLDLINFSSSQRATVKVLPE